MKNQKCFLLLVLESFTEVVMEPSRTFRRAFWWDSQICQRGCQLYPDFGLYCGLRATWMRRRRPFVCLCPPRPPRPPALLSALAQYRGRCRGATTSNTDERGREGARQRDRCRAQSYNAGRNMIVHQSKTKEEKKNFLLNWLYIQGKKNRNLSLSTPPPSGFIVPTVSAPPVSTFTRRYRSQFCRSGSKCAVYLSDWQHTQKLY